MKLSAAPVQFSATPARIIVVTSLAASHAAAFADAPIPAPVVTVQSVPRGNVPVSPATAAPTSTSTSLPGTQTIPQRRHGRFSQLIARLQLGVKPSYSRVLNARARASFGDGGLSVRPSYFRLRVPVSRNELGWDYGFNRAKFNDNRMTMVSVGAGYQHNFRVAEPLSPDATDEERAAWRASLGAYPYVGLGLNLVGTKLKVPSDNLDTGFKLGLGATVSAGYQIKTRMRLHSSLTALTSVSGYNFSTMRVAVDYKM